jgi:peptidoglycan/xylan/chitin deacetylase (PgdA/CDA1 family)
MMPVALSERIFQSESLIIPYYHMVCDESLAYVKHLYPYKNIRQFINDLDFLLKEYSPLSLDELIEHINNRKEIRKGFLLTFDDGFAQMYSIVAPILMKKGIPAVFFLNSRFIDNQEFCYLNKASLLIDFFQKSPSSHMILKRTYEYLKISNAEVLSRYLHSITYQNRIELDKIAELCNIDFSMYLQTHKPYLDDNQIKSLINQGFSIGAHSIDHPYYPDISLEDQLEQTLESLAFLNERYNLNYSLFAFPHGDIGVSLAFFDQVRSFANITFGTNGPLKDSIPFNLQRINFEKSLEPAKDILRYQLLRKMYYQILGKDVILRC